MRYEALVEKDGKLSFTDPARFKAGLSRLTGKRVYVSLETERVLRSTVQNRYWFGVIVETFKELWSKGRIAAGLPSYTKEQTHDVLVQVLLGTEEGPILGSRVSVPTRKLSTAEFSTLIEKARHMALQDYGMNIPEPGEVEITLW